MKTAIVWTALPLLGAAHAGQAQTAQSTEKACPSVATVITMFVRDAAGNSVSGASVTMSLASNHKSLGRGSEMLKGEYLLFEGVSAHFVAKGTKVRVEAVKGSQHGTATIVVATTKAGCAVEQLSGPSAVIIR